MLTASMQALMASVCNENADSAYLVWDYRRYFMFANVGCRYLQDERAARGPQEAPGSTYLTYLRNNNKY